MRERLLAVAERRAHLIARAQSERATLSALLEPADRAASLVASAVNLGRSLAAQAARYPLLVIAGVVLLAALRPRRAVKWLARGWSLWRLYRGASGWWQRFNAAPNPPAQNLQR